LNHEFDLENDEWYAEHLSGEKCHSNKLNGIFGFASFLW
jgi:hypothetical protein